MFLVVGAFWHLRTRRQPATTGAEGEAGATLKLTGTTLSVLKSLNAPVEIRFYSSLNPGSKPADLSAFAQRVDGLLAQYEQAAGDNLQISRRDPQADSEARGAAAADGVRPWTPDGGGLCYLGLAVAQGDRIELLPQLLPEWETALEPDVTRAIVRVTQAPPPPRPTAADSQTTAAAFSEVERIIPNLASVSLEEGTRILRESTLQEFIAAVKETQPQIDALEQRMREVQGTVSESERQRLLDQLLELQNAQKARLTEINAQLEAQVSALEQLKGVPTQPATATENQPQRRKTR